jgi:hypothetical protein
MSALFGALTLMITLLATPAGDRQSAFARAQFDASYGGRAEAAVGERGERMPADVVVRAADVSQSALSGAWTLESDQSSPGGVKLTATEGDDDAADAPLKQPASYFDASFQADAHVPYRVWLRLAPGSGPSAGTSVWVQFSDAEIRDAPAYRLGTRAGLLVSLDACEGCASPGWGWRDSSPRLAQLSVVTFRSRGWHRVRVQVRDGGVQLDQVVLSSRAYVNGPPGAAQGDRTTVARVERMEDEWRESR